MSLPAACVFRPEECPKVGLLGSLQPHQPSDTTLRPARILARDLLDRMFDVNQDSRISIEAIVAHPWFSRPLPPRCARPRECSPVTVFPHLRMH
jgi:serine/threonine protein kinase